MRFLSRLVAWFAFAVALFAPALARAALPPTCEGLDQLTRSPLDLAFPTLLEGRDSCDAGVAVAPAPEEDFGDPRVPAMCDERGASAIAPPRILPMTDARIEAAPGSFNELAGMDRLDRSSHDDPTASGAPALAIHAVLDVAALIPPATYRLTPAFPPVLGATLPGFSRRLDEPPR